MAMSERPKIGKLIFEGIFGKKDPGSKKRGKRDKKRDKSIKEGDIERELYTDR